MALTIDISTCAEALTDAHPAFQAEPVRQCESFSGSEPTDEDSTSKSSSPLGSSLLRIRRARAFLGKEQASALAEKLEAELRASELAAVQAVTTDSSTDETHSGGLAQDALDALCVDEDSSEEADDHEIPVLHQPAAKAMTGLAQAALDALCVENSTSDSGSEEEEQLGSADKTAENDGSYVPGSLIAEALRTDAEAETEVKPSSDEKKACKYKGEALLLRVRRLRAFRGEAEAASFAAKAYNEVSQATKSRGRSRGKPRPTALETPKISSPEISPSASPRKDMSPHKEERSPSPVLRVATPQRKRAATYSSANSASPGSPPQPVA